MNLLVNLSKFKLLLNKTDRNYFNIILIYQFLGSVLEAFGIALILPLLSIFLNQENQFIDFYSNLFGLEKDKLLISGLLIIIIFYFLKNLLLQDIDRIFLSNDILVDYFHIDHHPMYNVFLYHELLNFSIPYVFHYKNLYDKQIHAIKNLLHHTFFCMVYQNEDVM